MIHTQSNIEFLIQEIMDFINKGHSFFSLKMLTESVESINDIKITDHIVLREFYYLMSLKGYGDNALAEPLDQYHDVTRLVAALRLLGLTATFDDNGFLSIDAEQGRDTSVVHQYDLAFSLLLGIDWHKATTIDNTQDVNDGFMLEEDLDFQTELYDLTDRIYFSNTALSHLENIATVCSEFDHFHTVLLEKLVVNQTKNYQSVISYAVLNRLNKTTQILLDISSENMPLSYADFVAMHQKDIPSCMAMIERFTDQIIRHNINPYTAIIHAIKQNKNTDRKHEIRTLKRLLESGIDLCSEQDVSFMVQLANLLFLDRKKTRKSVDAVKNFLSKFTKHHVQKILSSVLKSLNYISSGEIKILEQVNQADQYALTSLYSYVSSVLNKPVRNNTNLFSSSLAALNDQRKMSPEAERDLLYMHELIDMYILDSVSTKLSVTDRPMSKFITFLDKIGCNFVCFRLMPRNVMSFSSELHVDYSFIEDCADEKVSGLILYYYKKLRIHAERNFLSKLVMVLDYLYVTQIVMNEIELTDFALSFRAFCRDRQFDYQQLPTFMRFASFLSEMGITLDLVKGKLFHSSANKDLLEGVYSSLKKSKELSPWLDFFNGIILSNAIANEQAFAEKYQDYFEFNDIINNILLNAIMDCKYHVFDQISSRLLLSPLEYVTAIINQRISKFNIYQIRSLIDFMDVFDLKLSEIGRQEVIDYLDKNGSEFSRACIDKFNAQQQRIYEFKSNTSSLTIEGVEDEDHDPELMMIQTQSQSLMR